jgi:hypothetical protein
MYKRVEKLMCQYYLAFGCHFGAFLISFGKYRSCFYSHCLNSMPMKSIITYTTRTLKATKKRRGLGLSDMPCKLIHFALFPYFINSQFLMKYKMEQT